MVFEYVVVAHHIRPGPQCNRTNGGPMIPWPSCVQLPWLHTTGLSEPGKGDAPAFRIASRVAPPHPARKQAIRTSLMGSV